MRNPKSKGRGDKLLLMRAKGAGQLPFPPAKELYPDRNSFKVRGGKEKKGRDE